MELYKRFIIVAAAIICAAAAVCGVLIAKDNTERRLYGTNEQIMTEGAVFTRLPFQPITQTPLTGPVGTDFPGTDRSIRPGERFFRKTNAYGAASSSAISDWNSS